MYWLSEVVGLPGFEPESMTPEATRITKLPHSPLGCESRNRASAYICIGSRKDWSASFEGIGMLQRAFTIHPDGSSVAH